VVVDFVPAAVRTAMQRAPGTLGIVADVRRLPIRDASVDAVVCVNFLDRSIFRDLARLLRPEGALVYETFTLRHLDLVQRGRARGPRNPAYLLADGELRTLVAPLVVREYMEGVVTDDVGERHVARVVAVKGHGSGRAVPAHGIA
jgi:SAM-dependent methyltransferase